jgi:hypothetical protein
VKLIFGTFCSVIMETVQYSECVCANCEFTRNPSTLSAPPHHDTGRLHNHVITFSDCNSQKTLHKIYFKTQNQIRKPKPVDTGVSKLRGCIIAGVLTAIIKRRKHNEHALQLNALLTNSFIFNNCNPHGYWDLTKESLRKKCQTQNLFVHKFKV